MRGVSVFSFCVLSFHNRLDHIREPAFYWAFYFPNLSLFVSSYVKMKKFSSFQFNRLVISWPPWLGFGVGLVTGSCHSLFFLLACPFVSRVILFIYDVRVRGLVLVFNETSHSFFV